jgi:hypothetical protein
VFYLLIVRSVYMLVLSFDAEALAEKTLKGRQLTAREYGTTSSLGIQYLTNLVFDAYSFVSCRGLSGLSKADMLRSSSVVVQQYALEKV